MTKRKASGEIELYVDDENRRFSEYIDARGDGLTFKRNKLNDADREEMRKFKKLRKYQNESGLEMSDDVLRRLGKHVSKKIIAVDETATKTCFSDSKNVNIVKKRLSFNVGLNYVGIEYSFEKNTHLMLELFQIMIELRPVMKLIVSITFNPSGEYIVPVMGVSKSHTNEEIEETFKDVKMVEMMEYEHSIPYRFAIWIDNDVSS